MTDQSGTLHLAQINIGRLRAPTDDPLVAEFMAALDEINALAERSPGFVWRFMTEDGNATAVRPYDDESILINMSVWESIESLGDYVYRTDHAGVPPSETRVVRASQRCHRRLVVGSGGIAPDRHRRHRTTRTSPCERTHSPRLHLSPSLLPYQRRIWPGRPQRMLGLRTPLAAHPSPGLDLEWRVR